MTYAIIPLVLLFVAWCAAGVFWYSEYCDNKETLDLSDGQKIYHYVTFGPLIWALLLCCFIKTFFD